MKQTLNKRRRRREGFTLIEMLIVIAIILILMGMLLIGIGGVRAHARKVVARTEVEQIAAAWKHYYSEYNRWPDFSPESPPYALRPYAAIAPDQGGPLRILRGSACSNNPRRVPFMEFNRLNADDTPITPWANDALTDAEMIGVSDENYYYVVFDTDFDNRFEPLSPGDPIGWDNPYTNDIAESVIVWAVNQDREPGEEGYIIGSWTD